MNFVVNLDILWELENDREQEEINPRWLGRALKRMGLIRDKRRLSAGVEVTLNIAKSN